MNKPLFTKALLVNELKHLGQLSKDIFIKEFLQSLACLVLPSINDKVPKHKIKDRFQTVYDSFKQLIIFAVGIPLKYCLFFISSFIEAAFDIVSLVLIFGFIFFQIPFGIALNVFFLAINNLLIHTVLLGVISHSVSMCLALIGSPFDHYARLRLCEYASLLWHDFRSLYEVILTILHPRHLLYTVLGFRYLNMTDTCNHLETNEPNDSPLWLFGMYSAIPKAVGETFKVLYHRLQSLGGHLLFMLSTPIFLILSLFEASLHATLCAEKTVISPAVWLLGKGQSVIDATFTEKDCFDNCSTSPLLV